MEKYLFVLIGFCSITSTLTATAFGPATVHQSNPSECYVSDQDKYYGAGESWQIEGCAMATCNWSNYTGSPQLMLSYESCGVVDADPPCYITEDLTLPYPACCPEPICPEETTVASQEQDSKQSSAQQQKSSSETEPNSEESKTKDRTEVDSDNEVDDTISILSDPKYFGYFTEVEGQGEGQSDSQVLSQLESNDLSALAAKFPTSDEEGIYDFRFQERKLPERFEFRTSHPKFMFHWLL